MLAATLVFAVWAFAGIVRNPGFTFLLPRGGAEWIRVPGQTTIVASARASASAVFVRPFVLDRPLENSSLSITALRGATVYVDQRMVLEEAAPLDAWKFERRVLVPGRLEAGDHLLVVTCVNDRGPPMIRLRWPDADLRTGPGWLSIVGRGARAPAQAAKDIRPSAVARQFPTVCESFRRVASLIFALCAIGGLASWLCLARPSLGRLANAAFRPSTLRWWIFAALLGLGMNNAMRLGMHVGADSGGHYDYIHYLVEHHRLAPLDQGQQNFQAPLFYVIAAAAHEILRLFVADGVADRALRLLPVLCGLGMVEISYRWSRRAFEGNESAQQLALILTATLPVLVVKTQVVSNEPLAGLLGAAASLAVLDITTAPPASRRPWRFAFAGALWGLAALSKVSALVLAAPFLLALGWWAAAWPGSRYEKISRAATLFAAFALTCGWYFVRNQLLYGKPVIGGWDPLIGFEWWQFPGYRTLHQYTAFGQALHRPVFSLVHGFWDGLYAGLWFDAEWSGVPNREHGPTWNVPFALAALYWALVPTLTLAIAAARTLWSGRSTRARAAEGNAALVRVYALIIAGAYSASILGHSLTLPYYNALKASYALAAVPALVVLIVAGFEPLLRTRWARIAINAWLSAWVMLLAVAYWALPAV